MCYICIESASARWDPLMGQLRLISVPIVTVTTEYPVSFVPVVRHSNRRRGHSCPECNVHNLIVPSKSVSTPATVSSLLLTSKLLHVIVSSKSILLVVLLIVYVGFKECYQGPKLATYQ